jgi:hypothetical protein
MPARIAFAFLMFIVVAFGMSLAFTAWETIANVGSAYESIDQRNK